MRTVILHMGQLYCSCRKEKKVSSRADGLLVFVFDDDRTIIGLKCEDCGASWIIDGGR